MRKFHKAGLGLALVAMIAAPAAAGPDHENHLGESHDTITHECEAMGQPTGDVIIFEGDTKLWPPNHKLSDPYTITAVNGGADLQTTLATEVAHEEFTEAGEEMNGAGNTPVDADPVAAEDTGEGEAETAHRLRAERSGQGDGRTYTILAEAEFDGRPCMTSFEVSVPHDMRNEKGNADRDGDEG